MAEEWTEIAAEWKEALTFVAHSPQGGLVQMGELNGQPGFGPMPLLLAALAGCTGMDIVSILKKQRVQLDDFQVKVRGKRATDYPMIWTEIQVTYLLWGNDIQAQEVERAIRLSEEKYCSVGLMLNKSARISSDYQIFNT